MSLILAIIIFNATSFIVYGLSSFFSKRMRKEYVRWGYSKERKLIGFSNFGWNWINNWIIYTKVSILK